MTTVITEADDEAIVVTTDEAFDPAVTSKVLSLTRDLSLASGSQVITGVGFKPRLILFHSGLAPNQYGAIGVAALGIQTCFLIFASQLYPNQSYAGFAGTNGTNFQTFTVSSFDVDGFTLAWTKTLSPTGIAAVTATCFR